MYLCIALFKLPAGLYTRRLRNVQILAGVNKSWALSYSDSDYLLLKALLRNAIRTRRGLYSRGRSTVKSTCLLQLQNTTFKAEPIMKLKLFPSNIFLAFNLATRITSPLISHN